MQTSMQELDAAAAGTNLTKLLGMARLSNSLIVGPTFVGKGDLLFPACWHVL